MEYKHAGKYLEEFNPGDKFVTPSRTITEADIVTYAGLSGDYHIIHTDEEFAKGTIFGSRIAHGPLTTAVALGLLFRLGLLDGTSMALLGLNTKFVNAVLPGDTIKCVVEVIGKRETKKPDRGILTLKIQIMNQREEVVIEVEHITMQARLPK